MPTKEVPFIIADFSETDEIKVYNLRKLILCTHMDQDSYYLFSSSPCVPKIIKVLHIMDIGAFYHVGPFVCLDLAA